MKQEIQRIADTAAAELRRLQRRQGTALLAQDRDAQDRVFEHQRVVVAVAHGDGMIGSQAFQDSLFLHGMVVTLKDDHLDAASRHFGSDASEGVGGDDEKFPPLLFESTQPFGDPGKETAILSQGTVVV